MCKIIYCFKVCGGYVQFLQMLVILAILTGVSTGNRQINSPSLDFSKHIMVHPVLHHGRTKRKILSTRYTNGVHHAEIQMTVLVDGLPWVLELRLNEDLVAGGHTLQYQEGGKTVKYMPSKQELDLCHYSGSVRGKPQSWIAVSTCDGVRGVIFDGQNMQYIEPAQSAEIHSPHYIYDHKDLREDMQHSSRHVGVGQGVGDVISNTMHDALKSSDNVGHDVMKIRSSKYRRQADPQVGEPYNANRSSRYVELVLVADHSMFQHFGTIRAVHSYCIQLINVVNSLYAPLNIYIALIGVVVWSERDEILVEYDENRRLDNFLNYRKNTLNFEIPNDNAHLLSRIKFNDRKDTILVGLAMVGTVCSLDLSGGVELMHTDVIGLQATTVAHEMGHNFGMGHDFEKQNCICPVQGLCIMGGSKETPVHWSSCSLQSLKELFDEKKDYCLQHKMYSFIIISAIRSPLLDIGLRHGFPKRPIGSGYWIGCILYIREMTAENQFHPTQLTACRSNVPPRLLDSPTCGNGFVEPGEQCDCGITVLGRVNRCHACCNPDTCMLHSNATCGAGPCCDFSTCRPMSAGVVCRSADRECDLPEYCTGHSEYCPADVYKMDSTPCGQGNNKAYCMQGLCRSHTDQCRTLYGASATSVTKCYDINRYGNHQGNCGTYLKGFKRCAEKDTLCGTLHCSNVAGSLLSFTPEQTRAHPSAQIWYSGANGDRCYYTLQPNKKPKDFDIGLVGDGATCGHEQMCFKQRCVSVKEAKEQIVSSDCSSNCSGHGICNSKGHCHCDVGYAPPLCFTPGQGGSVDSGPASEPDEVLRIFMIVMYAIFLGIIPSIVLLLLLIYYLRHYKKTGFQSNASCLRDLISFKSNRNKLDNVCVKEEHIISANSASKSPFSKLKVTSKKSSMTVNLESKKPLIKPVNKIKKDDIQIVTENINVSYVNHTKTVTNKIVTSDVNVKNTKFKINKRDIQVVNAHGVNNKSVDENQYANLNKFKTANDVRINPITPMAKINKNNIQEANTNDVIVRFLNSNHNKDGTSLPTHVVKLKPVESVAQPNTTEIKAVNIAHNVVDSNEIATHKAKLKPVNPYSINKNDNLRNNNNKLNPFKPAMKIKKANIELATDVKLKPVKKINKSDIQIATTDVKFPSVNIKPSVLPKPIKSSANPSSSSKGFT